VAPVLEAEDGSYIGSVEDGDGWHTVAFDQGGGVRWVVGGFQPQIALAGGGVVAVDGSGMAVTFDAGGNATGTMGSLPAYSWPGYEYRPGSVEQVVPLILRIALSWWASAAANQSGNNAAVNQWFPQLASCTDRGDNCNVSLGPRDLLWNAKEDLVKQLSSDVACGAAAQSYLFSKITYGWWPFSQHTIAQSDLLGYVQHTPGLYDGTTSYLESTEFQSVR